MQRGKKTDWKKKIPSGFLCKSLYSKMFWTAMNFFNFSPFNNRSILHSLLFKKSERTGGKEIWFILIYRLQFFLPIFSISIPLFSRSEKVHFKTLSKYPEHYSLYKTIWQKFSKFLLFKRHIKIHTKSQKRKS